MEMPAKLREALDEMKAQRARLDAAIGAIEAAFAPVNIAAAPAPPKPAAAPVAAGPKPIRLPNVAAPHDEKIREALRKAPPAGIPCADIVAYVFPNANADGRQKLHGRIWQILKRMREKGEVLEDSRLYRLATASAAVAS